MNIHPKSGKIGGDYFSAQKNWRKRCVNEGGNISQKKCVNHKNVMNFVTKFVRIFNEIKIVYYLKN